MTEMIEVTKEDANNYCLILTALEMEEDGDPVAAVNKLMGNVGTPAARWREKGETDPHGNYYDCEREKLCKGSFTDDELANAVYLDPDIGNLTAAKERIRWLSRKLLEASTPEA